MNDTYAASITPIYWEPLIASGERITAAVAIIGTNGEAAAISTLTQAALKILYQTQSSNASGIIKWVTKSLNDHIKSGKEVSDWKAPITGIYPGKSLTAYGSDIEDIAMQAKMIFSSLFSNEIADEEHDDEAFQSMGNAKIQRIVTDCMKRKLGFDAGNYLVDGGVISLKDNNIHHFLEISIKTENRVGAIASAWYKSAGTIETNILRAQNSLLIASDKGKFKKGIFIAKPSEGIPKQSLNRIEDKLEFLQWSLSKTGIEVHQSNSTEELSDIACYWSKKAA